MCRRPTKIDNEKAKKAIEALLRLGIIDEMPDCSKLYGEYPEPKVGEMWLTGTFALVLIKEVGKMNELNFRTLKVFSLRTQTESELPDFMLGWKVEKKSNRKI